MCGWNYFQRIQTWLSELCLSAHLPNLGLTLKYQSVQVRWHPWWWTEKWKSRSTRCLTWKILFLVETPCWSFELKWSFWTRETKRFFCRTPVRCICAVKLHVNLKLENHSWKMTIIHRAKSLNVGVPMACKISSPTSQKVIWITCIEVQAFNQSLSGHSTGKVALKIGNATRSFGSIVVWALHLADLEKRWCILTLWDIMISSSICWGRSWN